MGKESLEPWQWMAGQGSMIHNLVPLQVCTTWITTVMQWMPPPPQGNNRNFFTLFVHFTTLPASLAWMQVSRVILGGGSDAIVSQGINPGQIMALIYPLYQCIEAQLPWSPH